MLVRHLKYSFFIGLFGLFSACTEQTAPQTVSVAESMISQSDTPQPVSLTLYFWYGCPHCFEFRHYVQPWLEEWGDKLDVTRVPIALKPSWIDHARAFYAAQHLGVLAEFHPALYAALHVQKLQLNSVATLSEFAGSLGFDAAAFQAAMLSPATTALIRRDNAAVQRLSIKTTPTLVINDKQRLSLPTHDGYDALLNQADDIIEQILAL